LAHILGAAVSFLLPIFIDNITASIMGIVFAIVLLFLKRNHFLKSIQDVDVSNIGEVLFPLGIAIAAIFIWPINVLAYQGACLIFGLSDSIAGFVGTKYGIRKLKILKGGKTIEGSILFFVVSIFIISIYLYMSLSAFTYSSVLKILFVSVGITIVELMFYRGWDNIIIPVVAGLGLLYILP
jgi:dolichol kinase